MSNRHTDRLDDDLDRWVDDPSASNASRLTEGDPDGARWQRWHRLLAAAGAVPADAPAVGGDAPALALPPLPPPALAAVARAVVEAWRDPALRARLRAAPEAVLADLGVALPPGVAVRSVTVPAAGPAPVPPEPRLLELPLPAPTAPPTDGPGVRRLLDGTAHAWVAWAAFGPFDAPRAPAPRVAPPVRRAWWRAVPPRGWAVAGALAAVALVLAAAPGVLGPLVATAAGPAAGVRLLLVAAAVIGIALVLLTTRRR